MKKYIIILFLFLLTTISVNSISIDEFSNSYNYNYDNLDLIINQYQINNINNTVLLSLNLSGKNQNYTSLIIISNSNSTFVTKNYFNLNSSIFILNISLNIEALNTGEYNVLLFIYDKNENLIYRNYNFSKLELKNKSYIVDENKQFIENNSKYFHLNQITDEKLKFNLINNNYSNNKEESKEYFSDVLIKNITYNNITGESNLEIINLGNSDAINFFIEFYYENFTIINYSQIPYLIQNKAIIISFKLPVNLNYILVVLDKENLLDEKNLYNNILSWPVNLSEICFDKLDNNREGNIDENCISNIDINYSNLNFFNSTYFENINLNLTQNSSNMAQNSLDKSVNNEISSKSSSVNQRDNIQKINKNSLNDKSSEIIMNIEEMKKGINKDLNLKEILIFENSSLNIQLLKINPNYVELYYEEEKIILNKDESLEVKFENKTVKIKYIESKLNKAVFNLEFEQEEENLEFKTQNLNSFENKKENLNETNNDQKESFEILTNLSSNIYNSSNIYYFNSTEDNLKKEEKIDLDTIFKVILISILLFSIFFIIR